MGDLVTRLRLDSSQHNSELEKSKQKVHQYKDEADKAGKSIEGMGEKQSRTAKELLSEMSKIEGATRSTSNYKAQLAQISKQIQDLTINYRAMNSEMQDSDFGREVAAKITELTQKASEYKDAIMDAQQSVTALASDTAVWDGIAQSIDTVSSVLQGLVSTQMLSEKSTEKLVSVMGKLQSMQKLTNAAIKAGNFLQKQSKAMTLIHTIQTAALTKAKNLEAAATGKATIAQKAFNLVAKANPYVLLASAVIAVVGALALFATKSKDVEKAAKTESEAVKAAREEFEEYQKSLSSTTGDILSKYKLLQIQYSKLKNEHEKVQWIKINQTEFNNLGLKVKDLKSAEDTFINNTGNVVQALKKRAEVMANQNRLTKLYEQMMDEEVIATENYAKQAKKVGDKYFGDITEKNRHMFDLANDGSWVYNAKGVEEENKKIKATCFTTVDAIHSKIEDVSGKLASELDISSIIGGSSGGNSTVKPTIEAPAIPGSLRAAQETVTKLQNELNNLKWDDPSIEAKKQELEDAKKEVERIQQLFTTQKPVELFESGSLSEASHFVSVFQKQLEELKPNTEEFEEVAELLNIWLAKQEEINKAIEDTKKKSQTVVEKYQEIVNKANDINLQVKIGAIDKATGQKMIDELNDELKGMNLTAKVELEVDDSKLTTSGLDSFLEKFNEGKNSTSSFISAISSTYDTLSSLDERLNEEKDGVKRFFMELEAGISVANAVSETLGVLNTILKATGLASLFAAEGKKEEAKASAENAVANTIEASTESKSAITKMMEAIAGAAKAVASIPYVGPILAAAAAATVTGVLVAQFSKAKAQKFSTGGIFKGTSSVGDKNWARLNDGEMVLNTQQQKKLFQMLNSTGVIDNSKQSIDFGTVEFVIRGNNLVGTASNYNRKISHAKG